MRSQDEDEKMRGLDGWLGALTRWVTRCHAASLDPIRVSASSPVLYCDSGTKILVSLIWRINIFDARSVFRLTVQGR